MSKPFEQIQRAFEALLAEEKNPQPSGRVVLTPPTAEQEDYLREIERSTGSFDPNVVVGGPQSVTREVS